MTTFSLQQFSRQALHAYIERRYPDGPVRDFVIQYGKFERHETDKLSWYLNTIIDTSDESFYDVDVVLSSETKVEFESRKDCYQPFTLDQLQFERVDDYRQGIISVSAFLSRLQTSTLYWHLSNQRRIYWKRLGTHRTARLMYLVVLP